MGKPTLTLRRMSANGACVATSERPVLVGGCARSGTTLLRSMLNSHPDLAVPHETKFVVTAWRNRDRFGDLTRVENRRAVARWILELPNTRFTRLGIEPDELTEAFAAAPPTLGSLMAACFSRYAEHHGKPRWGDKRPSYSRNLDALFRLFPQFQFVHVVRDPRACAASMRRAWDGWGRVASAAEVWERTDKAVRAARRGLPAGQFLEIYYEHLVAEPEQTLEQICGFLGLDPTGVPKMLDYHRNGVDLPRDKLYGNAAKPVSTTAVQRWMSDLSEPEIAFLEHVLGDRIRAHGYDLTAAGTPVPADQLADYRSLRSRRDREALRRRLVELKRKATYRQPTAAQRL